MIIKTAKIGPTLKSFLIGAGIGSVGIGGIAAKSGYQMHKKKNPQLTFKQYLKKDKKRIGRLMRGGALFGGLTGTWFTKGLRRPISIPKRSISPEESARLLGLDNIVIKHKSQVIRAFREALKMHHANKPINMKTLKDIKKGTIWDPNRVVEAFKTVKKTNWYSKLAFLRR